MLPLFLLACSGPRGLCGEGTEKVEGECRPVGASLLCGPNTFEVDGFCEADPAAAAGATTLFLPFPQGTTVSISQGNQSGFSHNGFQAWAVDFPVPVGTPVAAVRSGVVIDLKRDSDTGCGDASCADLANFVRIDHGDGTLSQFLHLQLDGVDVELGDLVGRGQVIGRSGNTGWSTGPHLHLDLLGTDGFTRPVRFVEIDELFGDGTPFSDVIITSQNEEQPAPESVEPSSCASDAFLYRGVELTADLPCSVADLGTSYPLQALVPPGFDLAVDRYSTLQQRWITQCLPASPEGVVTGELRFGAQSFEDYSYLMLSAVLAGDDCFSSWSWVASPKIALR